MGKCACILTMDKATQFFNPFQYGVACPAGTEKIVHKLGQVIEDNWNNGDFAILKVDMRNAWCFGKLSSTSVPSTSLSFFCRVSQLRGRSDNRRKASFLLDSMY